MIAKIVPGLCLLILSLSASPGAAAGGVVITAVGDIMLAGQSARILSERGYDHAFSGISAELRRGDILVGNLEAPLTRGGTEFTGKTFRFRTRPEAAPALRRAGFTVLTLANNHVMDYGAAGLAETLAHLDREGILHAGAGASLAEARQEALVTVNGMRVAFLAYSLTYPEEFYAGTNRPGTAPGTTVLVREDIVRVRGEAEYVVVSFHWGGEREVMPKPYQRAAARAAIDAGADLVLGHHPHVLQGIERYDGKTIIYSLGNFAFGSMSPTADRSMIARVTLDGTRQEVEIVPINVLNSEIRFRPKVLGGKRGEEVIDRLNALCRPFTTRVVSAGGRHVVVDAPLTASIGETGAVWQRYRDEVP